ncbi:GTPase domain-containing protein [Caulobacter sp. AP07]|uniref:GTPase domain-containing protein n=1 Tax=Caulobacter sp. AP07 TaxID=1144304 RepID=UPI000551E7E5|nr:GTPase domain-containing protein [Caulobacter sp. AP07]
MKDLFALFDNLPQLNFDRIGGRLEYTRPSLKRPAYLKRNLKDRANSPHVGATLKPLFDYILEGTGKLKYGITTDAQWRRHMRFATDRLPMAPDGTYDRIGTPPPNDDIINWDADSASTWFLDRLLPRLRTGSYPRTFVIGDPGAGKSTLIKYLLNIHHSKIRDKYIIFSRFEYLKFKESWLNIDDIDGSLDEYFSYIMLRDAILFFSYDRDGGDHPRLRSSSLFSDASMEDLMLSAVLALNRVGRDPVVLAEEARQWLEILRDSLGARKIDTAALALIPHEVRASLLSRLNYHRGRKLAGEDIAKFCLIMDGLDAISIEDFFFEGDQHIILRRILERKSSLTNFMISGRRISVASAPMFVMRGNTFQHYLDDRQIKLAETMVALVEPIDPEVAIHNAVLRASDAWARAQRHRLSQAEIDREQAALIRDFTRGIALIMATISHAGKIKGGHRAAYRIFGNNIRTAMEFIHKIFLMFVDEFGARSDWNEVDTPEKFLRALQTDQGGLVVRQRRYRLVELLLFSYLPWFETAIIPRSGSSRSGSEEGRYRDNPQFTGILDNIFNYTTIQHRNESDLHCFLEKVRIIQSITQWRLDMQEELGKGGGADDLFPSEEAIRRKMKALTGYRPNELRIALNVLLRSEMIVVHVAGDGERGYGVTNLGQAVVDGFCRSLSYIEHVFHTTLFPRPLVEGLVDFKRESSVERWTAASIRNAFIWLTYLRFVEGNKAGGTEVPGGLRLWDETNKNVRVSITRMFSRRRRLDHILVRQGAVGRRAVLMINRTMDEWRRRGLIS